MNWFSVESWKYFPYTHSTAFHPRLPLTGSGSRVAILLNKSSKPTDQTDTAPLFTYFSHLVTSLPQNLKYFSNIPMRLMETCCRSLEIISLHVITNMLANASLQPSSVRFITKKLCKDNFRPYQGFAVGFRPGLWLGHPSLTSDYLLRMSRLFGYFSRVVSYLASSISKTNCY